eukprot:15152511-Ditylum_brightwellii.AAC.1
MVKLHRLSDNGKMRRSKPGLPSKTGIFSTSSVGSFKANPSRMIMAGGLRRWCCNSSEAYQIRQGGIYEVLKERGGRRNNVGSSGFILANIHEFRSRLALVQLDIVLVQEA